MDGAGSLTRSLLRSLRPQADLKAAAIGAVVLLREWVQEKLEARREQKRAAARSKAKAKPVIEREPPPRLVALVERYLPRRVGITMMPLLISRIARSASEQSRCSTIASTRPCRFSTRRP